MRKTKIAAALAAAGILAGSVVVTNHFQARDLFGFLDSAQAAPTASAAIAPSITPKQQILPDFATLVQQAGPAVVNITVSGTRKTGFSGAQDDEEENPLNQFFRGMPFRQPPSDVPMQGQGSGFIVGADGIVLTNAHVVQDANEVTVKLTDRREFRAKVLGADPASDIAVLRIDAKGLPVVNLGSPSKTRVGDWVVAIGSPFGFENSVSAGIVSAKGRNLPGESFVPFIQTDVAVNPGNSGGPLFNLAGEVIGINSQIYSRSGGYQGLSFAIPIDVALKVKDQIVATGHANHARLGVTVQEVNQALADSFGLKHAGGALVSSVVKESAAEKAGIEPGDIITKYEGAPIEASGELSAAIGQATPGSKVKLEVVRKGETKQLVATLGTAKADNERNASAKGKGDKESLGLAVRPLTPDERREAKVATGLVVEDVNGAAARAGIRPGDIVISADGKPITKIDDLRAASSSKKTVALLVQRGDARVFVPIQPAG